MSTVNIAPKEKEKKILIVRVSRFQNMYMYVKNTFNRRGYISYDQVRFQIFRSASVKKIRVQFSESQRGKTTNAILRWNWIANIKRNFQIRIPTISIWNWNRNSVAKFKFGGVNFGLTEKIL